MMPSLKPEIVSRSGSSLEWFSVLRVQGINCHMVGIFHNVLSLGSLHTFILGDIILYHLAFISIWDFGFWISPFSINFEDFGFG